MILNESCQGLVAPSRCIGMIDPSRVGAAVSDRCHTWPQCGVRRMFQSRDVHYPCPDARQGPYCAYDILTEAQLDLSFRSKETRLLTGLKVLVGEP